MCRKPAFLFAILACCIAAHNARAGGFYLQEQSDAAMGSAYAGAGAAARDASIMYYNPAGLAMLDRAQIAAGVSTPAGWADNTDTGSAFAGAPVGGGDSDDPMPFSVLPHGYAAAPVMDGLWLGIGISAPFGLATKYDGGWYGRFDSVKSVLKVTDIQPGAAWRPVDWLSLGAGLDIQYADAALTNVASNGTSAGPAKIEGSDWSTGYNLGLLAEPRKGTRLGLAYRSPVTHTLDGTITVTGVPGFNENSGGTAKLHLPGIAGLSLAQEITPRWTVLAQANRFSWNRFEDITVIRDNGTVAKSTVQNFRDTWSFALGAEYRWDGRTTLRFGYQYDQTPTRDEFRDTRIPDGDRNNLAAGVGYALSPNLTLNAAAMLALIKSEDMNVRRNANLAVIHSERDDSEVLVGTVGLAYKF